MNNIKFLTGIGLMALTIILNSLNVKAQTGLKTGSYYYEGIVYPNDPKFDNGTDCNQSVNQIQYVKPFLTAYYVIENCTNLGTGNIEFTGDLPTNVYPFLNCDNNHTHILNNQNQKFNSYKNISFQRPITLKNNSVMIVESEFDIVFHNTIRIEDNSRLILKSMKGNIEFRTDKIVIKRNSEMRIFSGGDVSTFATDIIVGEQVEGGEVLNDFSDFYAVVNDDFNLNYSQTWHRNNNGHFYLAVRDKLIFGNYLTLTEFENIRWKDNATDTQISQDNLRVAFVMDKSKIVEAKKVTIEGFALITAISKNEPISIAAGATKATVSIASVVQQRRSEDDYSSTVYPNRCNPGTVNWDYNYHYSRPPADENPPINPKLAHNYITDSNLEMYPKPTRDYLNIQVKDGFNKVIQKVTVFEMSGKLLKEIDINKSNCKIDLSDLAAQNYAVSLIYTDDSHTTEVISKIK